MQRVPDNKESIRAAVVPHSGMFCERACGKNGMLGDSDGVELERRCQRACGVLRACSDGSTAKRVGTCFCFWPRFGALIRKAVPTLLFNHFIYIIYTLATRARKVPKTFNKGG